mmetsp:Transcript_25321/g.37504  ORF Transcript_25321/g.37504 Transcript_25321/m.37504 type:complete len:235 (+) Transcript_25321:169-873(+)
MSRRRKRNIPIPSFAAADDADADADDVNANVNANVNVNVNKKQGGSKRTKNEKNAARTTITATTSTSSRNSNRNASAAAATSASTTTNNSETAEAISYLSSILKIETAMQLQQRRSTSTHAITSACISISMDKFIQIISKAMDVAGTHAIVGGHLHHNCSTSIDTYNSLISSVSFVVQCPKDDDKSNNVKKRQTKDEGKGLRICTYFVCILVPFKASRRSKPTSTIPKNIPPIK